LLQGHDAIVTLRNGETYAGVFTGASIESNNLRYTIKMAKSVKAENGVAGGHSEYIGEGDDHAMVFDVQDTVDVNVAGVDLQRQERKLPNGTTISPHDRPSLTTTGTASSFRTDVEISGNMDVKERELQRWEPGPGTDVDLSLGLGKASDAGEWDQFAANEKLYNVKSDYDEGLYTTTIDRSNPKYRQLEQQAEKLAREMERDGDKKKSTTDADAGLDEEDK